MSGALDQRPPAPPPAPGPLSRGTLGRRLVIRVTALVAAVAIVLIGATAIATRTALLGQIDTQLDGVANRSQRGDPRGQGGPGRQLQLNGQPLGTIAVVIAENSGDTVGLVLTEDGTQTLSTECVQLVTALSASGGKNTVTLPGLGRYRVTGSTPQVSINNGAPGPGRAYYGISLEDADHTLINLLGLEVVLAGLAIIGAAVGARAVVVRSLRPLHRVAATAQQVSRLPLDRGEVALAVRVPQEDADPHSEVGRVGQALNHMLNNVEDALAARHASESKVRQFVADASHELRNPLAAIRGYAELTRRSRDDMPPDAAYAMSRVESEAERMSRLVEDLLLLARLDSGPNLDLAPTDLSEIVINAVSDARVAGPSHSWQLSLPDEPVEALADRHRLHQVVANLLANARTHTPPGTRVRAAVSVLGETGMITVTDNGPGIPAEIQSQVFERFTRADTSRVRASGAEQGKSTGLGLAIVAAVVDAHHGSVHVDSQPGHTEFVVQLPLARPSDATAAPVPTTPLAGHSHRGPGPDMAPPPA